MRKFAWLVCIVMCIVSFAGCGTKGIDMEATVKIIDAEQKEILNESVTVSKQNPKAQDALVEACQKNKMAYQNKNGLFDGFNGIESEKTEGWLFYFNGTLAEKGLGETELAPDGENLIEMKYVSFDEAYPSE